MNIGRFGPLFLLLFPPTVAGQAPSSSRRVSFGFVGGIPLTRDFPISRAFYTTSVTYKDPIAFDWFSDTRTFLAALSVEIDLGKGFSLEANALHRILHLQRRNVFSDGSSQYLGESTPITWEWPIMAKYRLPPRGAIWPFIEAGPSFRTRHRACEVPVSARIEDSPRARGRTLVPRRGQPEWL